MTQAPSESSAIRKLHAVNTVLPPSQTAETKYLGRYRRAVLSGRPPTHSHLSQQRIWPLIHGKTLQFPAKTLQLGPNFDLFSHFATVVTQRFPPIRPAKSRHFRRSKKLSD